MVTKSDGSIDPWGWFEDFETDSQSLSFFSSVEDMTSLMEKPQPLHRALSLPAPATIPPLYILESTLETQQLWYSTAGRRPKQPKSERDKFEKELSKSEAVPSLSLSFNKNNNNNNNNENNNENNNKNNKNIENNNNNTNNNITTTTNNNNNNNNNAHSPPEERPLNEFNGEVVYRGANPFSNSVSKSFHNKSISAMTIQLSRFRIFRSYPDGGKLHAEFLVVVSIGNASTVTFGIVQTSHTIHTIHTIQDAVMDYIKKCDYDVSIRHCPNARSIDAMRGDVGESNKAKPVIVGRKAVIVGNGKNRKRTLPTTSPGYQKGYSTGKRDRGDRYNGV